MYGLTTFATLLYLPRMAAPFREHPWLFAVPVASMLAIANIPREMHRGREMLARSSPRPLSMVLLLALLGIGMFPELIHGNGPSQTSLTAFNASSSR